MYNNRVFYYHPYNKTATNKTNISRKRKHKLLLLAHAYFTRKPDALLVPILGKITRKSALLLSSSYPVIINPVNRNCRREIEFYFGILMPHVITY